MISPDTSLTVIVMELRSHKAENCLGVDLNGCENKPRFTWLEMVEESEYARIARRFAAAKKKQKQKQESAPPPEKKPDEQAIIFKSQHLLTALLFVWFLYETAFYSSYNVHRY